MVVNIYFEVDVLLERLEMRMKLRLLIIILVRGKSAVAHNYHLTHDMVRGEMYHLRGTVMRPWLCFECG